MIRLTREQSRRIDRLAVEKYHIPGVVLMENAARSAADVCTRLLASHPQPRVLIVCGGGNNGGDGLALARHLHNRRIDVTIAIASETAEGAKYADEAMVNWSIVRAMGLPIVRAEAREFERPDTSLIVDAVFGTGLSSPPRPWFEPVAAGINRVRQSGRPVLAIDLPSGLDCDTGKPLGPCVRATTTVTFVAEKVGFAIPAAAEFLGDVVVGDIGCPTELLGEVVNNWAVQDSNHLKNRPENRQNQGAGGAKSGAQGADPAPEPAPEPTPRPAPMPAPMPADLAEVAKAWPKLPADVRRTILHVVRATPRGEGTVERDAL